MADGAIANPGTSDPIQVSSITVMTGRLICELAIPNEGHRYTSPKLAAFVQASYPDLPHHACVNGKGRLFGSVIEHTSTAHLLEHLVICLQARASANPSDCFVGTTEWTDEGRGKARVEISFRDDIDALRAFNDALRFLNSAVLTCSHD